MGWEVTNNWADIADLRISDEVTDSGFTTETKLRLELRTDSAEIDLDDVRVFVGFHRMTLQLMCHGTEIVIGERYGDITPDNNIVTKIASETNTTSSMSGKAAASLTPITIMSGDVLSAEGSIEGQRETSENRASERFLTSKHVTAKPNDKWEISTLDRNQPLSMKYITAETPLCVIKPRPKSNRSGIEASLSAHKNDMVITAPDEKRSWYSLTNSGKKNKERVFSILLGKIIDENASASGTISSVKLSTISSFNEDAE